MSTAKPLTPEQIWGPPESQLPPPKKNHLNDYSDINWCPDCCELRGVCRCEFCIHCGQNITGRDRVGEYCPICGHHLGGET